MPGIGCSDANTLGFDYDFARGPAGWIAGFADYPAGEEPNYMLEAGYRNLPAPKDRSRGALFIAGTNRSDDLWMYYKVQAFLEPNTTYRVTFDVEIATAVPSGCFGVGGSPGEGVTVKAGASLAEPDRYLEAGYWRMTIDKGQQTNGGADALVVGDLANTRDCDEGLGWESKTLTGDGASLSVTTDGRGAVWLFVGTDSGFESRSEVYLTRYVALFERS